MSAQQIVGVMIALSLAGYAMYTALPPRGQKPAGDIDACAAAALALAARLRAAECPEGVAACQALLNVILEHPSHQKAQS